MPSLDRPTAPLPYDLLPEAPSFTVTSSDVTDGSPIELTFAHDSAGGQNVSPQLSWSGAPEGTKSYTITCFDPDAPTGSGFWHWVLFNVPATTTELARGAAAPAGAGEARNDFGESGYGGAAPPPGDRPHRYVFAVHALGAALDVDASAAPAYVGFNATFNVLARATLRPTFQVSE